MKKQILSTIFGLFTILLAWIIILACYSFPLYLIINYFIELSYHKTFIGLLGLFFIKSSLFPVSIVTDLHAKGLEKYFDNKLKNN